MTPAVSSFTLALILVVPTGAGAFRLHGRVVNGTTQAPLAPTTVKIVNPSGGMLVEREVQTNDAGHFQVDNLSEDMPVYLVRVAFQDVNYTEAVRFDGSDPQNVEIKVYERTSSWESIDISVPHMMIGRSLDTLTVSELVKISNTTSPPKTVHSDDKRLTLYIPPDAIQINAVTVSALGVPLPVVPLATDRAGFYAIDYPIRPGVTTVQASFDLPYANSEYAYAEPLSYDIAELLVITEDPSMRVASPSAEVGPAEDFHGFTAYTLGGLSSGDTLQLVFSGGTSTASPAGGATVLIVRNRAANLGLGVMIVLFAALVFYLVSVARKGHSPQVEEEVLGIQQEELLDQLARLDDLNKTGTVSDQMYQMKRAELVNALAGIYFRTTYEKGPDSKKTGSKGAVRV